MNELIFMIQVALIAGSVLATASLGKDALMGLITLCAVMANVFVLKQISLVGLNATAADVYIIGASLSLNVLQEYYGRPAAKRAIWVSFFLTLIFMLMSQ